MAEQAENLVVTITHGELHAMPKVDWEHLREAILRKGVSEEQVERCIRCDNVPEGMRLEFQP